jgi:hypothetical protein
MLNKWKKNGKKKKAPQKRAFLDVLSGFYG